MFTQIDTSLEDDRVAPSSPGGILDVWYSDVLSPWNKVRVRHLDSRSTRWALCPSWKASRPHTCQPIAC